jgi:hypothetical protein
MTSPRPRWPIGTLALMGLCVAGMLVGVILALNPPDGDRGVPKGLRELPPPPPPPPPSQFGRPPPGPDSTPRSFGGPAAPAANDPAAPRSR